MSRDPHRVLTSKPRIGEDVVLITAPRFEMHDLSQAIREHLAAQMEHEKMHGRSVGGREPVGILQARDGE
jgi:hypothetical protein